MAAGRMPRLPVSSAYYLFRMGALGAQTIAILLRRQSRATPCGRALVCEYRPGQALSPLSPEGKGDLGESGGAPSLRVKKGTGDDFRKISYDLQKSG